MKKSCSKCGRIHDINEKCPVVYKRTYKRTEADKLRNTYKWHKKSEQIKQESNYLCEVCRDMGIYNYENIEVHHIIKLNNDETKLLEDDNLICLCQAHHKAADKGELSVEYLRSLVDRRQSPLVKAEKNKNE